MAQESDFTTDPYAVRREDVQPHGEAGIQRRKEELLHDVKNQGRGFLAEQKEKTANIFNDLANALHASAQQLTEKAHPESARYLDQAAASMERFSGNLRSREVDEIAYKIRDFARRQPVLVLAGTLLAGFYLARLLKSGTKQVSAEEEPLMSGEIPSSSGLSGEIPVH